MSYKSPIAVVQKMGDTQIGKTIDGEIMKAVFEIGVIVDKDELLKALEYDREQYKKGYKDGLNAKKWIPCSERLPEEDGEYLVCYACGDEEDDEKGFMLVPFWTDIEKFGVYQDIYDRQTLGFVDSEFYECETVIAWMPLPKPYKGE